MTQVNVSNSGSLLSCQLLPSSIISSAYSGGGVATIISGADILAPDAYTAAHPNRPIKLLTDTHVNVSNTFFGIHTGTSPFNNLDGYGFGSVRSHDSDGLFWKEINTAEDVYDWALLDEWVDTHYSSGKELTYIIYLTPTWASARPLEGSVYGVATGGWAAEPSNMLYLTKFCTALATRYSGRIHRYECFNEPDWANSTGTRFFYSGTLAKLSESTRTIAQAIKAVDASAKIISPSVTGFLANPATLITQPSPSATGLSASGYLEAMLNASDGAGGAMKDWVDIIGVHLYGDLLVIPSMIDNIRAVMAAVGVSGKLLCDTEDGIPSTAMSDTAIYVWYVRSCVIKASKGVTSTFMYSFNHSTMGIVDKQSFKEYQANFASLVTTYGIDRSALLWDGRVAFSMNGILYLV